MKILIISDIHGNLHALESVLMSTPYDLVICCGDLVVGYPFPEQCIETIKRIGANVCMGNNDFVIVHDLKASSLLHNKYAHLAAALDRSVDLTRGCLGESGKAYLRNLPREQHLNIDGITFYMNHTAPKLSQHHYIPLDTAEQELIDYYEGLRADILITGHTHIPYIKNIGNRLLINPGSVGEPRDGDPRASFAVFDTDTGQVELNRLAYDTTDTLKILKESGYPEYSAYCMKYGAMPGF